MGLNLNSVYSRLGGQVGGFESELNGALGGGQADDMQSLLNTQYQLQRWSMATELQTNTMKVIGDSLKNTIQNIR
jgi:Type III secretion needle MxiH, YscF, SsaG, EprI, PscF, EscF